MEPHSWICPWCSRAIAPEDTFLLRGDRLAHLDCRRPRTFSPEERALLFRYCWDHAVAECRQCAMGYRMVELATDLSTGREHVCPQCRTDMTGSVREHFYNCTMLPAAVQQRAREAREMARRVVKLSRELRDQQDVLMRELEVALRALREAAAGEPPRPSH